MGSLSTTIIVASAGDGALSYAQASTGQEIVSDAGQIIATIASISAIGAIATAPGAAAVTIMKIVVDVQTNQEVQTSDILSVLGNAASLVGAVASILLPEGAIAVTGLTALGNASAVASLALDSTKIWDALLDAGNAIASGYAMSNSTELQNLVTEQSWYSSGMAAALGNAGAGQDADGNFNVPQTDSSGNIIGYGLEQAVEWTNLGGGLERYTFANGATVTSQPGDSGYDTVWSIPQASGITTTLSLNSSTGAVGLQITSAVGETLSNLDGIVSTSNGVITETATSSFLGGLGNETSQVTTDGTSSTNQSTVYNSDGSLSFSETTNESSGVISSDTIDANVNTSLTLMDDNIVLNGLGNNTITVYGQNAILNMSGSSATLTSGLDASINGSHNIFTMPGIGDTGTVDGSAIQVTGNDNVGALSDGASAVFSGVDNVATQSGIPVFDIIVNTGADVIDLGSNTSLAVTTSDDVAIVTATSAGLAASGNGYNLTAFSGDPTSVSIGSDASFYSQELSIGDDGTLDSVQAVSSSSTTQGETTTSVNEDGSGTLLNETVTSTGQAGTTTDTYDADGSLTASTTVGPTSTTVTTYDDPTDYNLRTVTTTNADGTSTTVTTSKDADGNYYSYETDADGNTQQTSSVQPVTVSGTETGIIDFLSFYQDVTTGQPIAAVDSAVNIAKFLAGNNSFLNEAGDGVDVVYNVGKLYSDIKNGNVVESIRDGTMAVADFLELIGESNPYVAAAVNTINFYADLAEKKYTAAVLDWLGVDEITDAYQIYELFVSIFGTHKDIQLAPLTQNGSLTLDAGDPTENDSVQYAQNSSSEYALSLTLGEGSNSITTGDGGLNLHADEDVGQDVITVNHDAGDSSTTRTLTFDKGVTMADVEWERDGNDVKLITGTGGSITIKNWFSSGSQAFDSVTFSDGTVWTEENNPGVNLYQNAKDNGQTLDGANGFNNYISTAGFNDVVTVDSGSLNSSSKANATIIGGTGNDTISVGAVTQFEIATLSGDDSLTITGTDDTGSIDLGTGNNSVNIQAQYNAFASDISIDLGTGNNTVVDGYEYTSYYYEVGGGNDTISIAEESETQDYASMKDIVFAQGISESDLTFTRVGQDLVVSTGTGNGSLTIANWFAYPDTKIGSFQFFDGSSLNLADLKDISIPYYGDGDLEGWDGDDDIYAGSGNDTLITNGGSDILHGGSGNDTFNITAGSNATVITGDGNDSVSIESNATVTLGAGIDTVSVDEGLNAVSIFAGAGHAEIEIGATASEDLATIYAGTGSISISGDASDSSLNYGSGDGNVIVNALTSDASGGATQIESLNFSSGISTSDVFATQNGNDLILSIKGQTGTITFADWFSDPARQNMKVSFADGTSLSAGVITQAASNSSGTTVGWNEVRGTSGNDSLSGLYSNEVFDGLGGHDVESAFIGNDTFVFNASYGQLEIRESSLNSSMRGTLQLGSAINASNVTFSEDNYGDLVLTDGISGDQVTVDSEFSATYQGIGEVQFSDGTNVSEEQLEEIVHHILGTEGADSLVGPSGGDVFDGKGGNDTISSSNINDTFIYDAGYGALEINADHYHEQDSVLQLGAGISASDLHVGHSSDGQSIVITEGLSGDSITLDNALGDATDYGVGTVEFADGTTWTRAQLIAAETTGTAGDDTLYGSSGADVIDGKGGNDLAIGQGGQDTFIYNEGYGQLEINEYALFGTDAVLQLGSGIASSSISVVARGNNIVITDGETGDSIQLDSMINYQGNLSNTEGVSEVTFADGTILSATQLLEMSREVTGTSGADALTGPDGGTVFDGRGGDDTISSSNINDTFIYDAGYGALEINADHYREQDSVLQLGAGISASDLHVGHSSDGQSIVITDGVLGDSITLDNALGDATDYGVGTVEFADGTTWTRAQLIAAETTGTAGDDTLYGSSGADVIDGKGGNDLAVGQGGQDTFIYNAGYGQLEINEYALFGTDAVLQFGSGISSSSTSAVADGDNIVITDGQAGDRIQLDSMINYLGNLSSSEGVTEVLFSDGTSLSAEQLLSMVHDVTGTSGADSLTGPEGGDVFDGKGGNDTISSSNINDTFVYNLGYGSLEINADHYREQDSVLQLGAGITASDLHVGHSSDGQSIVITDGVSGDSITLDDALSDATDYGVGTVEFADGTTWTRAQLIDTEASGTAGSDTLYGSSGADVIDGKGGNDLAIGQGGQDTFIYNEGYGQLEINEYALFGTDSLLQLGSGIASSSISAVASGNDIVITDGESGDSIRLDSMINYQGGLATTEGVSEVVFADGTTLTAEQLNDMVHVVTGTVGADSLTGPEGGDLFDGKGGSDTVSSSNANDTFVYNEGYGALDIDADHYGGQNNVLELGTGITASNIKVGRSSDGQSIIITDGIVGDSVTLDNALDNASRYGVATVDFADGTVWTSSQLAQAVGANVIGTTRADSISGTTNAEYFDGLSGQDTISGGGGDDTYALAPGYGSLTIDNGVSTSEVAAGALEIGAENDSNIWFRQVGNDLEVDVMGTSTKATVAGWFDSDAAKLSSISVSGASGNAMTIDTGLDQLIQAMATYSSQNPGFDPMSAANPSITDSGLLTQIAKDWHS